MRKERHKRRETFSVLMISNTGRSNRRYRISEFALRLIVVLMFLMFLICVAAGGLSYWALRVIGGQSGRQEQLVLQEQLDAQMKENERLSSELASLNESLGVSEVTEEMAAGIEEAVQEEPDVQEDDAHPNRFPSSGVASIIASYSQENPYMSFGMQVEDSVIATQDGTVVGIRSDDNYPHIIEMEHEGGYRTRYMCNQEADLKVQEGEQVEAGAALLTITVENTQLDYQVFLNDEPIDPINIIDAKG